MTIYTDEQVRRMAEFLRQEGYIAAPEMLLNMQADRTRLQAEVEALRLNSERLETLVASAYETPIPHGGVYNGRRSLWVLRGISGKTFIEAIDSARAKKGDV